jgi:hypothetical protein
VLPGLTRLRLDGAGRAGGIVLALLAGGDRSGPAGSAAVVKDLVGLDSGLSASDRTIIYQLRLPRVVLAMLVGATLAICGAAYQVCSATRWPTRTCWASRLGPGWRHPRDRGRRRRRVATPMYIDLCVHRRAGLGDACHLVGTAGGRRGSATTLILAGVAVASFMTRCRRSSAALPELDPRGVLLGARPADHRRLGRGAGLVAYPCSPLRS